MQSEISEAELQERKLREEAEMLEADEQGRRRRMVTVRYSATLGGRGRTVAGTRGKKHIPYVARARRGCMRVW